MNSKSPKSNLKTPERRRAAEAKEGTPNRMFPESPTQNVRTSRPEGFASSDPKTRSATKMHDQFVRPRNPKSSSPSPRRSGKSRASNNSGPQPAKKQRLNQSPNPSELFDKMLSLHGTLFRLRSDFNVKPALFGRDLKNCIRDNVKQEENLYEIQEKLTKNTELINAYNRSLEENRLQEMTERDEAEQLLHDLIAKIESITVNVAIDPKHKLITC